MGGSCETVRYEFGFGGSRAPERPWRAYFPGALCSLEKILLWRGRGGPSDLVRVPLPN